MMKRLLTFLTVTFVSFSFAFTYWIDSIQVNEYVSLTLYKPFVYRQLVPMLARTLIWFGIPANWAIVLMMTTAGIGFYYALRALIFHFYKTNDLYILALWSFGLMLFWWERLPSDWMTACLFSLALLFLVQDRLLAYCLLFPIICSNRYETALLLILFHLIYYWNGKQLHGVIFFYQLFTWMGFVVGLHILFANNGGADVWMMPVHNLQVFFAHPLHSLLHIAIFGAILLFVFKDWNSKPIFLRTAFVIFAPILLIAYWVFGQAWEVRVLFETYPVAALLMLPSIVRVKEFAVLCDGGIPNVLLSKSIE